MKKLLLTFVLLPLVCGMYAQQNKRDPHSVDWPKYNRYAVANDSLKANHIAVQAVFMGNSITDYWGSKRPEFFLLHQSVSRGISGQTTYQMLIRMQPDVIDLAPEKVFIMAGINDIACNSGAISDEHIVANIQSMCELALFHHIQPIVCSIMPVDRFYWYPDIDPRERIVRVNRLLQSYAQTNGLVYVDYYSALVSEEGGLLPGMSYDGAHPTIEAYAIMESIVLPYLK